MLKCCPQSFYLQGTPKRSMGAWMVLQPMGALCTSLHTFTTSLFCAIVAATTSTLSIACCKIRMAKKEVEARCVQHGYHICM